MFRFISGEWDELENGFNFWRLSDKYSFGLKFVWGDAEEGKHMITLRYSKVTKKFDFRKRQSCSRKELEEFYALDRMSTAMEPIKIDGKTVA